MFFGAELGDPKIDLFGYIGYHKATTSLPQTKHLYKFTKTDPDAKHRFLKK